MAVAGIYFAVYFWARMSGRLRNDLTTFLNSDDRKSLHICWAPGGICEHPPHPVGQDPLVAVFRPAAALESMAPGFFQSTLKPEFCDEFKGRFSEKEARRFVRVLLGHSMDPGAAFAGGEFDSSANLGIARFRMSEGEFRQWFGLIDTGDEYVPGPRHFYERFSWQTPVFFPGWANTLPRKSVWWNNGVVYVREDYGCSTPDLEITRLEL